MSTSPAVGATERETLAQIDAPEFSIMEWVSCGPLISVTTRAGWLVAVASGFSVSKLEIITRAGVSMVTAKNNLIAFSLKVFPQLPLPYSI